MPTTIKLITYIFLLVTFYESVQSHGSFGFNSFGGVGLNLNAPLGASRSNVFSGFGSMDFQKNLHHKTYDFTSGTVGLAVNNVNGHGFSVSQTHLSGVGDRLAAAAHINVFRNDDHKVGANAFAARTTLDNPAVPSFNTLGGGLDYTFRDKVGASVSMARTPMFDKTDCTITGNLNLFREPSASIDVTAGVTKSVSPHSSSNSWEPSIGVTLTKKF